MSVTYRRRALFPTVACQRELSRSEKYNHGTANMSITRAARMPLLRPPPVAGGYLPENDKRKEEQHIHRDTDYETVDKSGGDARPKASIYGLKCWLTL